MKRAVLTAWLPLLAAEIAVAADTKLTGVAIGSSPSVEYVNFSATTTQNLPADAFDGDLSTFYASYERSYTWVGLDLGSPHVITRVGWSPRNDGQGEKRVQLALFEGANEPDFMDALPLYLIDETGKIGVISHADVDCSVGFRYVRYVSPSDARCNVAEIEFYGHPGAGDSTRLYRPTNLPCVVIHTRDNQEPYDKVNYIESIITILSETKDRSAQRQKTASLKEESQTIVLRDTAGLRLRGNASTGFPKKPYRIKFAHKHHVLGSPANAKNWTLINNYGDKSLMRNIVAFEVSRLFEMPYTPFCRAVDVLLNGEYKGCYQLCDKIEVKKGRIEVEHMTPEDVSGKEVTGGYMWEIDSYAYDEDNYFYTDRGIGVTLHYPDADEVQTEQQIYFENYFRRLENSAYRASATDSTWRKYLDYSTFARYFLVNELCGNPDLYWSMYMYKQRDDLKAYTCPVWDFDIAFDNDNRIYPLLYATDYTYGITGEAATFAKHVLFADQSTHEQMVEYWHRARNNGINAGDLTAFADSIAAELDASQRLNFLRWPILRQYVHQNPVALGSYDAEVQRLKEYLSMRVEWMDSMLGYEWHPIENQQEGDGLEPALSDQPSVQKIIRDGQLLILHDGKQTNILGL